MKKHSFLLIEVLIAISLLAIFAPWLMRLPINHYKKQIEHFEELEKHRISDWTYSEIKEMLLKRSIPWEKLPEFEKPAKEFSLPNTALHLPGLGAKDLKRSFTLTCKKEKESQEGQIFRLYELKIFLETSEQKYRLLIQRI